MTLRPTRLLLLLGAATAIGLLYWQPLRSYAQTREVLNRRERDVEKLREQKRQLEQRLATVGKGDALIREARRLGLVKPGERLFIVRGISTWRQQH
jgi:cell division protein FtsB